MPDGGHHAQVVKFNYEDGNPEMVEPVDHMRESIEEGKPSGISRAWDQPGRDPKPDRWIDSGPRDREWDRKSFLKTGKEKFDAGTPDRWDLSHKDREQHAKDNPQGRDKYISKSYGQLPPMLQRLVKKNVRAKAAEGPKAGRRGDVAGYKSYDNKHMAQQAVGFDPAPQVKWAVNSGQKIDPAVNKRLKDFNAFKDTLRSGAKGPGGNAYGPQDGKMIRPAGSSSSYYSRHSNSTRIHHIIHPEHGEFQLMEPERHTEEPSIYHRPVGAARGKNHKWSSPEAQKVVSDVMSSGEGWPKG
jgi:hypothetical protein